MAMRWAELLFGVGVADSLPHWSEHSAKEAKGRRPASEAQQAPRPKTLSLACWFTNRSRTSQFAY